MFFDGWEEHKGLRISRELLWEYDIEAPQWDWQKLRHIVVARVLERGRYDDYYAMFNLYGGYEGVRKIIRDEVRHLHPRELAWACVLFRLKKEEMSCFRREQLRRELIHY